MPFTRISIGTAAAMELTKTKWWEGKTAKEIARFQLFTVELCCPLEVIVDAVEASLGRPVWTSDLFTNLDEICAEFLGQDGAPDSNEIASIPAGNVVPVAVVTSLERPAASSFSVQDVELAIRDSLWPPARKKPSTRMTRVTA